MANTDSALEKLLDERFAKFSIEQETIRTREKALDRLEDYARANGLREDYAPDLRSHFHRRSENEDIVAKAPRELIAEYKKAKPNLFARTSPTAKGDKVNARNDSGTTENVDHAQSSRSDFSKFLREYAGVRG